MNRSYLPFIDWLKCLGMVFILYGHLAGWAPLAAIPPIYSKQLGVAFFLFASGYSFARETGDRWRAVFNRLFEVFLFGLACALLVTIVGWSIDGGLRLSNFLPFLLGANVLRNGFPANPTTWYLGTYLQIVLLWGILAGRLRITPVLLVCTLIAEIAIRATVMSTAGLFVAYMTLPNWITVLLFGYYQGQRGGLDELAGRDVRARHGWLAALSALVTLIVVIAAWATLVDQLPFQQTFPLMTLPSYGRVAGALTVSAMVSSIYLGVTWLTYRVVAPLPALSPVRFVARNTLIIFLAHMPLFFLIAPTVTAWTPDPALRSIVYMVVCLPGLGLLSELVRAGVRPREWRDKAYARLFRVRLSPDASRARSAGAA
jgi:peptidoglycan/LPS O-acetylase OafA/YrhL